MHGDLGGLAESDDGWNSFRSGAAAALVASAHHERIERRALADVHGADALGRVHLVAADGQHMAANLSDVDRNLASALHRVDMEKDPGLRGNAADLFDRLDDARLVVGQHHADQPRLRANGAENLHGVDQAVGARIDLGRGNAVVGQPVGCGKHRRMLDRSGNQVVAGVQQAKKGSIVAFGAARGEDDLSRVAAEKLGQGLAGLVHGSAGALALLVDRGGVAVVLHPVRAHGLHHLRQQGCGGIGVHIDSAHGRFLLITHCT